jgi:hypothetical protein
VQPPAAWLIADHKAIPATFGSFCYRGTCADMVPPEMIPDLATVSLGSNEQVAIIVGSVSIKAFSVTSQEWTAPASGDPGGAHQVIARSRVEGNVTVFTLDSLPDTRNQLLQAFAAFAGTGGSGSGDATYYWRINHVP